MRLLLWILYPFSLLYQFFFYLKKTFTNPFALPSAFVISIGNLTVGGTGKTPFIHFLIPLLQKEFPNLPIVILSRGYGGRLSSEGTEVTLTSLPSDVGEEQKLHKVRFPDVRVLIGKNRKSVFLRTFEGNFEPKLVLLDDGFQHFALKRNLDLLLVDSTKGFGNGFTIPLGFLREPVRSLHRASAVIFTKLRNPNDRPNFNLNTGNLPLFHSYTKTPNITTPYLNDAGKPWLNESNELKLITAVGNPNQVQATIESFALAKINERKFKRDHYSYSRQEILEEFQNLKTNEWIITTEKDFIKWQVWLDEEPIKNFKCLVMDFPFGLVEEESFIQFLRSPVLAFFGKT